MKEININKLISDPANINKDHIEKLNAIIFKYPFFSIGHILKARGLVNIESIRSKQQIQLGAIYCNNRQRLFEILSYKSEEKKINENDTTEEKKYKEQKLSFNEWINFSDSTEFVDDEINLIDKFINDQHTSDFRKNTFFSSTSNAKNSLIENQEIVTETLAEIYFKQGHLEKSIESYEKLILKFPKKSTLFAKKIKLIKDIIKK